MATVHSFLYYCGAAWQPWLARYNMQLLERAQHLALRVMTGQLSDTPLECLRLEAGITSFSTTVRKNCVTAMEKSARQPFSNPRRNLFDSPVTHLWKNINCFSVMGKEEEAQLGLDQLTREMFVKWHPPPWSWNASPLWTVRLSLMGGSSKRNNIKNSGRTQSTPSQKPEYTSSLYIRMDPQKVASQMYVVLRSRLRDRPRSQPSFTPLQGKGTSGLRHSRRRLWRSN